jgi:hypothetical protein
LPFREPAHLRGRVLAITSVLPEIFVGVVERQRYLSADFGLVERVSGKGKDALTYGE